jgi:hypothetical protein
VVDIAARPVRGALEKALDQAVRGASLNLERAERDWVLKEFMQEVMEFGPITALLDDRPSARLPSTRRRTCGSSASASPNKQLSASVMKTTC